MLLLSEPVDYACKQPYTADRQWLFFAIGLAVVAVTFAIAFLLRGRCSSVRELLAKKSTFTLLISLCSIVLLFVQCFIVRSTWFETDWDVRIMAKVDAPDTLFTYLSQYPNQAFLYGLFRIVAKAGSLLGLQSSYLSLVLGGCVFVTPLFCFAIAAWAKGKLNGH